MVLCEHCKAPCKWKGGSYMPSYGCIVGYVPTTNADRIRAMTDEELAEEIWMGCPKGKSISTCCGDLCREPTDEDCVKCWLEWLKRESEDEQ